MLAWAGNGRNRGRGRGRVRGRLRLKNDCEQRETGRRGLDFLSLGPRRTVFVLSFFNRNRPRTRPRPRDLSLPAEASICVGRAEYRRLFVSLVLPHVNRSDHQPVARIRRIWFGGGFRIVRVSDDTRRGSKQPAVFRS